VDSLSVVSNADDPATPVPDDDASTGKRIEPSEVDDLRRRTATFQQVLAAQFKPLASQALIHTLTASRIAESQQALVARALRPVVDSQSAWHSQFASALKPVVSSDLFKSAALIQSNLNLVASRLTQNIDFGITESFAKLAANFAEQQSIWLRSIGPAITAMRASFYPPNLRAIESLKLEEVEQVVMVDGIPLYGLPRASIAEALIRADGMGKRRDILGRRWKAISGDCRAAIEGCNSTAVSSFRRFALAALDALDEGHHAAGQALAGSLVDAILTSYFGKDRSKYTPDRTGKRTKDAYDEFSVRQFIAFAPIWQAYQQFHIADGDLVPMTFSRHASAHTVSSRQFSRRNSVQGIMLACSLICRLDEEEEWFA